MTTPVDRYLLEISRVYFAHIERGMSLEETVFAVQGEHKKVWGTLSLNDILARIIYGKVATSYLSDSYSP